jgi:hypothetical protein
VIPSESLQYPLYSIDHHYLNFEPFFFSFRILLSRLHTGHRLAHPLSFERLGASILTESNKLTATDVSEFARGIVVVVVIRTLIILDGNTTLRHLVDVSL